jgi:hypothetical protein
VFDVQPIRNDYGRLLSHYEWLADAAASLNVAPPKDLLPRVVKAADRWRQLDPEATEVPNRAAAILRKAGGPNAADLAWEYVTTPLALKPNESGPWVSLASSNSPLPPSRRTPSSCGTGPNSSGNKARRRTPAS